MPVHNHHHSSVHNSAHSTPHAKAGSAATPAASAATTAAGAVTTTNAAAGDHFAGRHSEAVDRPFEVLFTPKDDAYGYEAQCIQEVIDARKADPRQYTPENNPYKIHYMVFNLRNAQIIDKLFAAIQAGVEVQVLVEADQISAERPWNKVDEAFEAQGYKVIRSDKQADAAALAGAKLIGIDKGSLMHMKSRIFRFKDPDTGEMRSKVLSGSLNPGGAPVLNEENINVMTDKKLVERYEQRFYEVRDHKQASNPWDDNAAINVLFTPNKQNTLKPTQKLFEWIDQEQEMILLSVFALRNLTTRGDKDSLVDKLQKAQARGVKVMVITDRHKSDGTDEHGKQIMMYGHPAHNDDTDELMQAAGIPVFELVNNSSGFSAVHGKSAVFGLKHMKVLTGAGNWTQAAMGSRKKGARNEESFIFIDSDKLDGNATGRAYAENFLHLLRRFDGQYDARAADVIRELQQQPGWPKVTLDLSAFKKLHAGKKLYLISDDPAIRARTPQGEPGLPIDTSPSASSPPFRPQDPVKLPYGTRLTYRLAERDATTGELHIVQGDQLLVVDDAAGKTGV